MSLPLDPGTYEFDRAHSQFAFGVTHLGITPVVGLFTDFEGTLVVGADAESSTLRLQAQMASVNSGNAGRDEHLQAPDFFDTANHPVLSFTSSALSGAGDTWTIDGDLVIKGQSQKVQLTATFTGRAVFPMDQKEHIGATATGTISRVAAGIGAAIPASFLSDDIALSVAVQLIKAD